MLNFKSLHQKLKETMKSYLNDEAQNSTKANEENEPQIQLDISAVTTRNKSVPHALGIEPF